jgi:hypothetical protein
MPANCVLACYMSEYFTYLIHRFFEFEYSSFSDSQPCCTLALNSRHFLRERYGQSSQITLSPNGSIFLNTIFIELSIFDRFVVLNIVFEFVFMVYTILYKDINQSGIRIHKSWHGDKKFQHLLWFVFSLLVVEFF